MYYIPAQPPQAPSPSWTVRENHGMQKTSHDIQLIQLFQLRSKEAGADGDKTMRDQILVLMFFLQQHNPITKRVYKTGMDAS
jgi:hypothetical protein